VTRPPFTDADARRILAAAVRSIEPGMHRALREALAAWQRDADAVPLRALEAALAAGGDVVPVLFGDAAAVPGLPVDFPDAASAFGVLAVPVAIRITSRAEATFVRRVAEAVRDARRLGDAALPPVPPPRGAVGADAPEPPPRRPAITFTPGLPGAADAAADYGGRALRYLQAEAHAGVRAAVAEGLAAGRNPRDIARSIRDVVGLGDGQARWVTNLRAELETGRYGAALDRRMLRGPQRQLLAAAVRNGRTLTPAEIQTLVTGYRTTAIAERAETIARTMALDLAREGQLAALRDAIRRGDYAGLVVLKTWVTTLDGRERPAHRALSGRTIPFSERWNDDGVLRSTPGGWRCRCSLRAAAVPPDSPAAQRARETPRDRPAPTGRTGPTPQPPAVSGPPADLGSRNPILGGGMGRENGGRGGSGGGGRGPGRGAGGAGWSDDEIRALEGSPDAARVIRDYVGSDDFATWLARGDDGYVPIALVSASLAADVGSQARILRLSRRELVSHAPGGRNNDHPEMREPETYRAHLPALLDDYRIVDRRGRRVALVGGEPRYMLVVRPTADERRLFLVTLFRSRK
jgi:hypothetical protein